MSSRVLLLMLTLNLKVRTRTTMWKTKSDEKTTKRKSRAPTARNIQLGRSTLMGTAELRSRMTRQKWNKRLTQR